MRRNLYAPDSDFLLISLAIPTAQAADNPVETQIRQAFDEGRLEGLHGVLVTLGD